MTNSKTRYINVSDAWGAPVEVDVDAYIELEAMFRRHEPDLPDYSWTWDDEGIYCDGVMVAEAVKSE